jgi:6-pyruvoyltetrahydropterin/6-carboxytetrahydropterin synthase
MTRRVGFSSGHRYWLSSLSEAENRSRFGKWASPYNHGHNYLLDVTVEGSIEPTTGMVVNIKRIDDVLKSVVVSQFDGKSINDEVAFFQSQASSLENLMLYIADQLNSIGALPAECRLTGLRLEEMPSFYGELSLSEDSTIMTLSRTYEFAASHRLDSPYLSPEENLELFGKCNNPAGHGHNYVLEVTIEGSPDPSTGMIANLEELDRIVEDGVVERYDHKNLNVDIPEFQGRPTTSEIVALEIFERLKDRVPAKLARIRLFETARNMFEVSA